MASTSDSYEFVKHKPGKPLRSGEKNIVLNVFNKLCEKNPTLAIKEVEKLTSEFTGVSAKSVHNIRKEKASAGKLVTPCKNRQRSRSVLGKFDDFDKHAVRLKVHNFFHLNEIPTLNQLISAVNDDPALPNITRSSLYKLLLEIGFEFVKRNRKNLIIDRDDITLWRRNYLKQMREFRDTKRNIFYLDETWINEGHVTSKAWHDSTVTCAKQAFLGGLSTGLKMPSKGKRLILLHIGSEEGFLDDGILLFESKKSGDYHREMNGDTFRAWFEKIIKLLPKNSVVVMDNAPYHSVKIERVPNTSWRKDDIIKWLSEKNIPFDKIAIKAELLETVKKNSTPYNKYVVDELAKKEGHTVLRLPPYHCMLNPIEMVWSQVKGYVARNNVSYKLKDVKTLVEQGLALVTADKWRDCINHVIWEEKKMWQLDHCVDVVIDRLILSMLITAIQRKLNPNVKWKELNLFQTMTWPNDKDYKVDFSILDKNQLQLTNKMEVENQQGKLGEISVKLGESTDINEQLDLHEGDISKLEVVLEIEIPMNQEYEVNYSPSANDSPDEEDPSKLCKKSEFRLEDFEFQSVGPSTSSGNINCDDYCEDSFQSKEMNFQVVPDDSPEEDPLKMKENPTGNAYEEDFTDASLCVPCETGHLKDGASKKSTLVNCSDMEKYDCTHDNLFYCNLYPVKTNRKDNMTFYVKQCYKVKEQALKESKNHLEESVVDATQHLSRVRNDVCQNEIASEGSKIIKQNSKKISASENLKLNYKCGHCCKVFEYYSQFCSHLRTHTGEKPFVCEHCAKSFTRKDDLKCHIQTHTHEKPFLCEKCNQSFTLLCELKRHILTHTGEKPFVCEHCKKSFARLGDLKQHIRIHTGEKPFVCEPCAKSFTRLDHLKHHILTHTGEKPFVCEHCAKSFLRKDDLKQHILTHTGEKPFVCEHCKRSFARLGDLKQHIRIHTGEKPFVCEHCAKSFRRLGHLKHHILTHTGEKPFVCEHCAKSFTRKDDLKQHILTHTGERPFVCEHCAKSFTRLSDLKRHIRTHAEEKPFVCEHCAKSFTRLSDLKRHIRTHTEEKPFVCEHCKKSYTQLGNLKRHILSHTGEKPFLCEHCAKSFTRKDDLKCHMLTHTREKPFLCEHCKRSFTRLGDLKQHIQIHTGEKSFVCEHCAKSFPRKDDLKQHILTHTGEKPFVCKHCAKSFSQLSELKRHRQTHTAENLFVCEHCKKSFTQLGHLKCHILTHTVEKPFVNENCTKSFVHKVDLKRHILTHAGEKPFACERCKKSFARLGDLKQHIRIHTGEKPFACERCKKSFARLGDLKRHIRIHTGEKHQYAVS